MIEDQLEMNITAVLTSNSNRSAHTDIGTSSGSQQAVDILKYLVYGVIFLTSLCGNSFVCWVVWRRLRMRTVMNYYLVNLAVADLAFTLICIPFDLPVQLKSCVWPYSEALCKALFPLQTICAYASVFTLTAIGFSRYRAIVHPLKTQMSLVATKGCILAIWITSFIFVLPYILILEVNPTTGQCAENWPEPKETYSRLYTFAIFFTEYALPLTVVFVSYLKICCELRKKGEPNADVPSQPDHARDAEKVLKMSIAVTTVFAVCTLPNHIVWLVFEFGDDNFEQCNMWIIAANIFVFANSAADPVVYTIFNEKYREELKNLVKRKRRREATGQNVNVEEIL